MYAQILLKIYVEMNVINDIKILKAFRSHIRLPSFTKRSIERKYIQCNSITLLQMCSCFEIMVFIMQWVKIEGDGKRRVACYRLTNQFKREQRGLYESGDRKVARGDIISILYGRHN